MRLLQQEAVRKLELLERAIVIVLLLVAVLTHLLLSYQGRDAQLVGLFEGEEPDIGLNSSQREELVLLWLRIQLVLQNDSLDHLGSHATIGRVCLVEVYA